MNTALVLAGGTGTRLGSDIPKQYIKVNGKMIIDYCLKTLDESEYIDAIWIVADSLWQDKIKLPEKFRGFSLPGDNRQLSIYNGINDIYAYECSMYKNSDTSCMIASDKVDKVVSERNGLDSKVPDSVSDIVLIHDAARPNLTDTMIQECINTVHNDGYDGAMPVLTMKDTVYMSSDGKKIDNLIDRSTVYAGQAPEVFVLDKYIQANKRLLPDRIFSINGSSEPAVLAGMNIALVNGDENNYKITTKADLERFIEECSGDSRWEK